MDNFERGWAEMQQGNDYIYERQETTALLITWACLALSAYFVLLVSLGY